MSPSVAFFSVHNVGQNFSSDKSVKVQVKNIPLKIVDHIKLKMGNGRG